MIPRPSIKSRPRLAPPQMVRNVNIGLTAHREAYSTIRDRDIIAANRAGLKMRNAMRREFLARARHAGRPKIVDRKPVRARKLARARARRSPISHGGSRKAASDSGGDSNGGDGPPPPRPAHERCGAWEAGQ